MAAVQIWFHQRLTESGLPTEPPLGYLASAVGATNVSFAVPSAAGIAVIETDGTIAYRGNSPAVLLNDPQIQATAGKRYVVDCGRLSTLHIIAT